MYLIDDMLHEFKGELSYKDICSFTQKEIHYLREHRRKMMSSPKEQEAELTNALLGNR